jgi:hypothetical protein
MNKVYIIAFEISAERENKNLIMPDGEAKIDEFNWKEEVC